jgi:ubiquinone/menaquinone biosynthesis C-methylase UbiE
MEKEADRVRDPYLAAEGVEKIYRKRARYYRLLHHITTRFRDTEWRREVAWLSGVGSGAKVLDICTGIALSTIEYAKVWDAQGLKGVHVTGIDFNEEMLRVGRHEIARLGLADRVSLLRGDAMDLGRGSKEEGFASFPDSSFDAVLCICGIGGVENSRRAYQEMLRVVKEGGRVVLLDIRAPLPGLSRAYSLQRALWNGITVPWVLRRLWGWGDPTTMADDAEQTTFVDAKGRGWALKTLVKAIRTDGWWLALPIQTTARFVGMKCSAAG